MPELLPFRAWRYAPDHALIDVTAPPYDVLSQSDVEGLARDPRNIVHVDVPTQTPEGYAGAAATLRQWMADGTLVRDDTPTLTLYRLSFTDATGAARQITGVLGALPVMDYPTPDAARTGTAVLPHEHVTAKASTDRLDLTRATGANLSPVWGLSLAAGLAGVLTDAWQAALHAGAVPASLAEDGVTHEVVPIRDERTIAGIIEVLTRADVLIADGHHRYGVAQRYLAETGAVAGSPASRTLAFVNELVDDQLSVEAIHRVYDGVTLERLIEVLTRYFELTPAPAPTPAMLADMVLLGRLVLLAPDGAATWLTPRPGAFDDVRALDGAWLEHALAGVDDLSVGYQHGLAEALAAAPNHAAVILIRPTSIDEIRRTATEALLMPPKSTFFTPKLRTGLVVRTLD